MKVDIQVYQTLEGKSPFLKWLDRQSKIVRSLILKRLDKLEEGHLGDYRSIKGVKGIFELRFHQSPGFRIYFGKQGKNFVLLLCGGTKGNQTSDIEKAASYWEDWRTRS